MLISGCGGRACRLPVPASLQHTAAGGGSNTFSVESAVVRPISGGGGDGGSGTFTPSSQSPRSSTAASEHTADHASTADYGGGGGGGGRGTGGRGGGHDAAAVFRQGAEAYHMPPLQLVPPGTTFDPNASPEVQVRSMAVCLS